MKKTLAILVLLVAILSLSLVSAGNTDEYGITQVEIEGVVYNFDGFDQILSVERGSTLEIEVTVVGNADADDPLTPDVREDVNDINIEVRLGGYEYGSVSETTARFEVEGGVTYVKTLELVLPEDLDADGEYTLTVEAYDEKESFTHDMGITLLVERTRHLISVVDILVDNTDAGNFVAATVRLENMGDFKEEDIKVTLSNDELGFTTSEYLSELAAYELDNEDEEDSGEVALVFQVPADAVTGDYELSVVVEYDRGHETLEDTVSLFVNGVDPVVEGTVVEPVEPTVTVVVVEGTDNVVDEVEDDESDVSTALRIGFGILAVLIVILALILIVRR
jgi:hypothetical protein